MKEPHYDMQEIKNDTRRILIAFESILKDDNVETEDKLQLYAVAAESIGKIGDMTSSIQPLIKTLTRSYKIASLGSDTSVVAVRDKAKESLIKIGKSDKLRCTVANGLINALSLDKKESTNLNIAIIQALGELGAPEGLKPLLDVVNNDVYHTVIRTAAIEALTKILESTRKDIEEHKKTHATPTY